MTTDSGPMGEIEGNTVKIRKSHPVPEKNRKFWKVLGIDCRFGGNERDIGKHRKNPEKSSGSGKKPEKPEILESAWNSLPIWGQGGRRRGNEEEEGEGKKDEGEG